MTALIVYPHSNLNFRLSQIRLEGSGPRNLGLVNKRKREGEIRMRGTSSHEHDLG